MAECGRTQSLFAGLHTPLSTDFITIIFRHLVCHRERDTRRNAFARWFIVFLFSRLSICKYIIHFCPIGKGKTRTTICVCVPVHPRRENGRTGKTRLERLAWLAIETQRKKNSYSKPATSMKCASASYTQSPSNRFWLTVFPQFVWWRFCFAWCLHECADNAYYS